MSEVPNLLPTGLVGFDLLFGGLPRGELLGMFAESQANKTILAHELAYRSMMFTGRNGLSLDTEGSNGVHILPMWFERWNKRFGGDIHIEHWTINLRKWEKSSKKASLKKDQFMKEVFEVVTPAPKGKQKMIVLDARDLVRLMLLVGKVVQLTYGKERGKGKIEMHVQPLSLELYRYAWNTPLAGIIEEHGIEDGGILVLDSLTMPVEVEYTGGLQSFPGRRNANMMFLARLRDIVNEYKLYSIVTQHEITQDPAVVKQQPKAVGGAGVQYNFKFFMDINKAPLGGAKDDLRERRRVQRDLVPMRHPHYRPRYTSKRIEMTDEGVIDV